MTSFLSPTGNLSSGVQVLENNGTMSSVSPTQPLQYVGNDGLGQITTATLVAGTGIQIEQVGDTAVFSTSTGSLNLWNSILTSVLSFNFSIPLTQSISSQTQTIPYSSTAIQNSQTFTCTSLLSVLTAKYLFKLATNVVAKDNISGNNTPVILAVATYMTDGSAPTAGQLPIDVSYQYVTATSVNSTASDQLAMVNISIKLQPTTTTFGLYVVPYIYADPGSTLSGTVIETNPTSGNVGYVYESNQYAIATPTTLNQLQISKASFTIQNLNNTAIPKQNTGKILLSTGTVAVGATPAQTMISFSAPGFFSNLINGGQTFLFSYFIEVNGVQVYTDNIGNGDATNFIYQQMIIDTPLLTIANGATVDIYLSYSTYTGQPITAYFPTYGLTSGNYFISYYSVFVTDAATAIGTLSLPNEGQTIVPVASDITLPTSVIIANYEPPSSVPSAFPTTSAYAIDTVNVNLDNGQNLYRVEFSATIYTDAHSIAGGDTPCVALYVYETTGSGASLTPVSGVAISYASIQNYVAGNLVAVDIMCEGYINLLSSGQLTAYACLFSDTINVSSTTFKAIGTDSPTIPDSASFWTLSVQSIGTSSGGGSTTTITVDAGSYLTANTTTSGYDLGTTQASPTQAGLVATADLIPANDLIQMSATGAVGCTITSADSSVTVVTTEGNIDLSTVGVATTVTALTGSFLVATDVAGDYELDTQQASPLQDGLLATVNIIPANDLLQMGAAGTVGCTLTSTNGSVSVTTTEGNIDLSTVAAASSGAVGVYSPLNQTINTLSTDTAITTAYISASPTLAQMQQIASSPITASYSNTGGVGSTIQASFVTGVYTTNTNQFGVQFCLYSSVDNYTTPLDSVYIQQGSCSANTRENYVNFSLQASLPSEKGVSVTFVVAASQSSFPATIDSSSFVFVTQEEVPNTQSVVSTQLIPLGSGVVSVSSTASTITTTTVTKQYANSYYFVEGSVQCYAGANTSFCGDAYVQITATGLSATTQTFHGSGKAGTGITASSGINTEICLFGRIVESGAGAVPPNGTYTLKVLASTPVSTTFNLNKSDSSFILTEILPLADGGNIQTTELTVTSSTASPYVTTLSPQYSTMQPVGSFDNVTRVSGSTLLYTFYVESGNLSTSTECELIIGFYTSNASTATPYAVRRVTAPSGNVNLTGCVFAVTLPSPGAEVPIPLYIAVGSLTSGNTTRAMSISGIFNEFLEGSVATAGSSVSTVTAASNSYLQASTVGSAVTLNTTQSSTSQAGLVATSASVPANSLIQMGATGAQGCTLAPAASSYITTSLTSGTATIGTTQASGAQAGIVAVSTPVLANSVFRVNAAGQVVNTYNPYVPFFGNSIVLAFGGASVGVVYTARSGTGEALYGGTPIPPAASGQASNIYAYKINVAANIANTGTSTGIATLSGIPITPVTQFAGTWYAPVEFSTGITVNNNNILLVGYSAGSSVLTFYQKPSGTNNAPTALTDTAFAATNVQFEIRIDLFSLSPPTT